MGALTSQHCITPVGMSNAHRPGAMMVCLLLSSRRGVLTAVLFVRVVLAVVVAVAQPGAADAFAVVAVEVHR